MEAATRRNYLKAKKGDINVVVWVHPNYYHGTLMAKKPHGLADETGLYYKVFATFDDAQDHINKLNSSYYRLKHGEYSRPTYEILKHKKFI